MKRKTALILLIFITIFTIFSVDAGCVEAEHTSISLQCEPEVVEVEDEELELTEFERCAIRHNEIIQLEDKREKLIQYTSLINEYRDLIEPPILLEDMFSDEDIELMARCVETETYQQSFDSKVHVACVVLNRFYSTEYPDEIDEIITDGQFAFWRTDIADDTYMAIQYAWLFGSEVENALWFNSYSTPVDFYGEYFYTDDAGHHFYKPCEVL